VNRAKLYYLRKKVGKKARVRAKQYGGPVFSTDAPPPADEEAEDLDESDEPEAEDDAELEPDEPVADGERAAQDDGEDGEKAS
jgi:hypothetical protein